MVKPWVINELAHAGQEHLDRGFVARYDRKAGYQRSDGSHRMDGTDPAEDVAILREHGLGPTATLVDLGAGTGRLALAAAHHLGRVVAVDVSPAMLDIVRDRAAGAGHTNVECVQAGFLTYEHAGAPADAVYSRHALHQLPDFWKVMALHRIAAMLRPRGVLRLRDLIFDFQPADADDLLERWLASAADDPARGYTRGDLAEHIRTEHSTLRWLFEPMLAAAGFEILSVDFRQSVYGAYTCVKR
jgi:ubiquinone/menaquinone biosynthesis C-methylase UbiE